MFGFGAIMLISWIIWMIFRASKTMGWIVFIAAFLIVALLSGTL
jgi:hypothetical protein